MGLGQRIVSGQYLSAVADGAQAPPLVESSQGLTPVSADGVAVFADQVQVDATNPLSQLLSLSCNDIELPALVARLETIGPDLVQAAPEGFQRPHYGFSVADVRRVDSDERGEVSADGR